ncbi:MAG: adenylyltransferase/cytidyltransferase family protein [Microgenomates group bacterium]
MPILSYNQAQEIVPTIKNSVGVSGCFDILHVGHLHFLQEARTHGEHLIILLEGDEFITKAKNRSSFHTQAERAEILSALKFVDYVVVLPYLPDEAAYAKMYSEISLHTLVVSTHDPYRVKKQEQIEHAQGKVILIDTFVQNKSTSKILEYFG